MAFKMKGSPMARNFGIGESAAATKKKDDSPLDKIKRNVNRHGLKRGLNKKYSTKSRNPNHNRQAELGNKKLNRLNAKEMKMVRRKGRDVYERSTLALRQGKQLKKAINNSYQSDYDEYKRKEEKHKTTMAERAANKENDANLKEEATKTPIIGKNTARYPT